MKEPERIPLTDSPRNKEPKKIPLNAFNHYDIEMLDDIYEKTILAKKNEDNQQDNSKSVQ